MDIPRFRLSYPVESVSWNGDKIVLLPKEQVKARLDVLRQCGIRDIMAVGYTDAEKADFDMLEESCRWGECLLEHGMNAAQHHGVAPTFAPLNEDQHAVVEKLKRSVDYTVNLHAEVLVIHPCRIDRHYDTSSAYVSAYEETCRQFGLDRYLSVCAANLHEAGEYALSKGVKIALENVDRFEASGDIRELPELIERSESEGIGFCLDIGHCTCCGTPWQDWLERLHDKLLTTHVHDNHGPRLQALSDRRWISPSPIDEHLPPGFGIISWMDFIQALWKYGYHHTLNFESGPWPGQEMKRGYELAIDYWRTCEYLAAMKQETEK